jgi:adenylate kinase
VIYSFAELGSRNTSKTPKKKDLKLKRPKYQAVSFLGLPGSGKGTTCKSIHDHLGNGSRFLHVEMSHVIKLRRTHDRAFDTLCDEHVARGELIPCRQVMGTLSDYLGHLAHSFNLAIDGVPRTHFQAGLLEHFLKKRGCSRRAAFYLQTTDERAKANIAKRVKETPPEKRRADDLDPEAIETRLNVFKAEINPVLDFYRANNITVVEINADVKEEDLIQAVRKELEI